MMLGTRVAETILASGHVRPHTKAGHMIASDPIKSLLNNLARRVPSTYGGRGYCGHPAYPTRPRRRLTLARRPTQAQAAETRCRGASEQDRAHRLEANGERRDLQSEAYAASL